MVGIDYCFSEKIKENGYVAFYILLAHLVVKSKSEVYFVYIDDLCISQQFFSHVGTISIDPRLN